ncbi:MAG: succinylglutamate desuccinylase/aspartoacylase family protein [Albidovulum sp.]|nr:succinylglutamate desuccinylase/aspartoacylase family protein [Albidovulum sp.]
MPHLPPEDAKNLHWLFPGNPDGSYSECLAHALQSEWAIDADIVLDLHGGDRGETLCEYVVFQKTEDEAWNRKCKRLAACFDTEFAVGLSPAGPGAIGRICTGLADQRRIALVCESGINGVLDPGSVNWHREGIVNVARHLGILHDGAAARKYAQSALDKYEFVRSPLEGMLYPNVEAGSRIDEGDVFAELRDCYGRKLSEIPARVGGVVLMHSLHQFVEGAEIVGSIAYSSRMTSESRHA